MRIVVNDIAACTGGAMSVLKDFYTTVCSNDKKNQWIFLLSDRYFEETENVKIFTLPEIKKSHWKKLWFDLMAGRTYISKLKPDVVFSLQNIITFGIKQPQILYIHQSIPFQNTKRFSFLKKQERGLALIQYGIGALIKLSARCSSKVIVQSRWMKQAVCQQCHIPAHKVLHIQPNVKLLTTDAKTEEIETNHFFYPTAEAIYKNNECLIKASSILKEAGICHKITVTLPAEQTAGCVQGVGRLPYEEVIRYYKKTTLVFPSYIETFGYPLAEARTLHRPILAADTAFSREVLENYENAYFFHPSHPEELANLMKKVISGEISLKPSTQTAPVRRDSWLEVLDVIQNTPSVT